MTAPLPGSYRLDPEQSQIDMVLTLVDAQITQLPELTQTRSSPWILANVMPAAELQIDFPPPPPPPDPPLVTFLEAGRPPIAVPDDGSSSMTYDGPEGLSQLVRAYLLSSALIVTYHGQMDRMSILRQPIGSPNVLVHHRFTADRLPDPLRFDLVYAPTVP